MRKLINVKFSQLILAALLVAPCLFGGAAHAQSYLSPGYIMGEIRDGLGIAKTEPAPEFVVRGRPDPATLEYTPLKPPPRGFHSQAMTPGARLQAEASTIAELEAARAETQSRAAASGAPALKTPNKTVAPPPEEDPQPMKWDAWNTD